MDPKTIKQRRLAREHAERRREFDRMIAKSEEDQRKFDQEMADLDEQDRNIQFVTQMACSMPITLFTTKEDTDRWMESVHRMANELGVPFNTDKPKLRKV